MTNLDASFSYWEQKEWLKPPDLLVVGAGIVGASVALFYKQMYPDKDVLVVDRGFAPRGASTRNAGFSCIGSISEHLSDISISGEKTVFDRIKRRWEGLHLLRETIGDHNMDYHQTGGIEIFTDPELFDSSSSRISEFNEKLEKILGVSNVYSTSSKHGYPAITNRLDGAINSGKLIRNLHQKLSEQNIRIWWNCPVRKVESQKVTFLNGFQFPAENIVLAVNGFHSTLVNSSVKPARGFIFVTKPIQNLQWKGTFNYNEGYVYFRDVGDNKLLLGGGRNADKEGETTSEFGVNPTIKEYLIHFANDVLHLPKNWEIEMEWSGIMGMTPDKEPIIEETYSTVWSVAGLSGMGIAIGLKVAKELIDKMMGRSLSK